MSDFGSLIELERMRRIDVQQWALISAAGPQSPESDPQYSELLATAGERIYVWNTSGAWCPLVRNGDVFTAVCPRDPVVAEDPHNDAFIDVAHAVAAAGFQVYFPLVGRAVRDAARARGHSAWLRRGNPVVDWRTRDESIYERALRRGTSQVARKRRRLEDAGYQLSVKEHGADAARRMLAVDRRSWKTAQGQGMEQRGVQAKFYSTLVSEGFATASFLNLGDEPVAFRLDVLTGDTLACLKWSYDENHRRVSPGLYLLTTGLDVEWGDTNLETIDLHGGPDNLKRLVESRVEDRFDVWVGDWTRGRKLRANRLRLDDAVAGAVDEGQGLRHAY